MSFPIKTTISIPSIIFDENGKLVPSGNYYYKISEMSGNIVNGELISRGNFGVFAFKNSDLIRMMSIAQSRLFRRAGINDDTENIPNYDSPPTSPSLNNRPYSSIVDNYLFEQEDCSICLQKMKRKCVLKCNHSFHLDCITRWFDNSLHRTCPVCREREPYINSNVPYISSIRNRPRSRILYNNFM